LDHPFLLLNEPFSRIELLYIRAIKQLLADKKKSRGFIITDQYYRDILDICDSVCVLRDGSLVKAKNEKDLESLGYLPSAGGFVSEVD